MKKLAVLLVISFLFLPLAAHAFLAILEATVVIVKNTVGADGDFSFNLAGSGGFVGNPDFKIQTTSNTGSFTSFIDYPGSSGYYLTEDPTPGWQLSSVSCTDPGDASIPITNGIHIFPPSFTKITCTFTNTQAVLKTPVLIVPGVLGTDIYKGGDLLWANSKMARGFDSFMDPLAFNPDLTPLDGSLLLGAVIRQKGIPGFISHYTDNLISEFVNQGYTEGKDLFTFPYDWRYGVTGLDSNGGTTVDQLKGQIDYILTQTNTGKAAGKVDIVAHSTGALIVKKYVMNHPSDHRIGKAVFVGIPNLGAPKALKALLVGDDFDVFNLDPAEMKKIAQNMPIVYDLAPTQQYYDTAGSFLHLHNSLNPFVPSDKDLSFAEAMQNLVNQGLANQNAAASSSALHTAGFDNFDLRTAGVDLYSVVGCKTATFGKFSETVVKDSSPAFDFPLITSGDKTVPFVSADSLAVDGNRTFFVPKVKHGDLLSANGPRQQIVNILAGAGLNTNGKVLTRAEVSNKPALCQIKGESLKIKSPVSIDIVDQDGNHNGPLPDGSIEESIPGSDYEVFGEHKYIFLPTDDGQTYNIQLKGTGTGTFTVDDQSIDGDSITQTQVFSNLPVTPDLTGQVNLATVTTLSLTATPTSTPVTVPSSSVVNASQSLDITPPVSSSTLTGTMGQPGFYRSTVTIQLSAQDPIIPGHEAETSGILKTRYSLDNGGYLDYASSSPIAVSSSGPHTINFFSIDRAGNLETEQSISFTIDKTAPEISFWFNPITKDFGFAAADAASASPRLLCATNQCTAIDQAGNTTMLKFDRQTLPLNIKNLIIKSLSYNGQNITPDPNVLSIGYTLSGSNITKLSQTELIKNQQIFNILYTLKQNQSTITDWSKGTKPIITSVNGQKILLLSTDKGKLKTGIK